MQVIGLCRFSYPALGGFQVEHDSVDDRIAFLYAEHRLEERFRLFETVALPCLRHQTDPDFLLIVVIGDQLPARHRRRLETLTADIPQIRIEAHPPRRHRDVMKEIINDARGSRSAPCLQFRHDDDDAFALDFVARLRQAAEAGHAICRDNRTVAFDWNRGHIAEISAAGIAAGPIYRPFYVAALGMHVRAGDGLTIMNFMHERLPQFMPALSFPDDEMWVRTHNTYNDSRQKPVKAFAVAPLTPAEEETFRARFAIDADHVRRVFGQAPGR
ncbi:hypothetical protein OB2597_08004 [Pseudooceanicola batsensis HTCC2597]|uniref:Rhamnosyl transferase n=1 Tax=Pseudooceanicola batsensis (strain ATCC BAA-863 / DSM 15984 / KCTC 12145 / HTCC2597) TaxID=252305 RepID=A3TU73_PSEBH|nr:putative rhamnosyl transferase [Pseudooceanicola batsensis]EAQ04069.1 hypothetical protein OB2597_08004 [Pseudooceanicola batsensis HTCC2597]